MGVPFSAALCFFCVCVSHDFLMLYLRCRITWDVTLLFCPRALKRIETGWSVGEVWSYFSWDCTRCCRPHEQQTPPSPTQPCLHKAYISSTQRQCLLSEVTARPWTPAPQLNDHPIWPVSFLHPHFSHSLWLFVSVSFERKKHMFPSTGRHIKHKLFLVKGWALFQGQSETLSGQQRAIRALATTQVCTEYICSVNICIQRINGLDRPLITG